MQGAALYAGASFLIKHWPPAFTEWATKQLTFANVAWSGEAPPQKWMKFYTTVLSKFAAANGLKLKLTVEVAPEGGISKQKIEETKAVLRELGTNHDLTLT